MLLFNIWCQRSVYKEQQEIIHLQEVACREDSTGRMQKLGKFIKSGRVANRVVFSVSKSTLKVAFIGYERRSGLPLLDSTGKCLYSKILRR